MAERTVYWYRFEEFNYHTRYSHLQRFIVPRKLEESDIETVLRLLGSSKINPTILNNKSENLTIEKIERRRENSYSIIQIIFPIEKEKGKKMVEMKWAILLEDII